MRILTAKIDSGLVRGVSVENSTVFRGIPYAKAGRFMPPEKPDSWEGERVCDTFSPICIQPQIGHMKGMPFADFFIKEFYPEIMPMSEDSLALNVWTPAESAGEKLPVMVWFHGGGMTTGYGHEQEFDGEAIAARGVILVTVNYRLGFFGYFTTPEMRAKGGTANNAIRDQIAALEWVQRNISAFGGDSGNVTIFGQSAGGGSVISHLCSPKSDGLFHRAIIHSGIGGITSYSTDITIGDSDCWGEKFLAEAGKSLDEILAMNAEELQNLYSSLERKIGATHKQCVDGDVFTASPGRMIQSGSPRNVSIMVGSNNGDGCGPVLPGQDPKVEAIKRKIGDKGEEFLAKFPPDKFPEKYETMLRCQSWFDELTFSIHHCQKEISAYMYHFRPYIPGEDETGLNEPGIAFRSSELWYIFGTQDRCWRSFDERHKKLSAMMTDYWTNFAKAGNPNGTDLPEWCTYEQDTHLTCVFTEDGARMESMIDDEIWGLAAFKLFG